MNIQMLIIINRISLVNEVMAATVGKEAMASLYVAPPSSFLHEELIGVSISYYQAYELIRGITGYGNGNGPIMAMHEGFLGIAAWDGFLNGADRM